MKDFVDLIKKVIIKSITEKKMGSSVFPELNGEDKKVKPVRIPKGVQKERAKAMAKIKDIAKIKIEHRNEKKLREILEDRGLKKKKQDNPTEKKKGPIIQTNYKIPKKKEENESK